MMSVEYFTGGKNDLIAYSLELRPRLYDDGHLNQEGRGLMTRINTF